MSSQQNEGSGPLIGSIIIVLLLLAGGYYSFKTSTTLPPASYGQNSGTLAQPAPAISQPAIPPQESTEIIDIEEDAKTVDVSDIDTGLDNLDLLVNN